MFHLKIDAYDHASEAVSYSSAIKNHELSFIILNVLRQHNYCFIHGLRWLEL